MRAATVAAFAAVVGALITAIVYIVGLSATAGAIQQRLVAVESKQQSAEIDRRAYELEIREMLKTLSRIEQKQDDFSALLKQSIALH